MEILTYFIETEIKRRHIDVSQIDVHFQDYLNQLDTISLVDFKRIISPIFTPYELIIIEDLQRQYQNKQITKQKLYASYLIRKIESLPLLLMDKEIEIGQLIDTYDHAPVSIVISFKYDLSLTFDFKSTPASESMLDAFYQSGSLKSKTDFLEHLTSHYLVKNMDLIIQP